MCCVTASDVNEKEKRPFLVYEAVWALNTSAHNRCTHVTHEMGDSRPLNETRFIQTCVRVRSVGLLVSDGPAQ